MTNDPIELPRLYFDTQPEWLSAVRAWADDHPEITHVHVYGSRVSGKRREKPSPDPVADLDLAVQIAGEPGEALAEYIVSRRKWQAALMEAIPVKVDIKHHDPADIEDDVRPYLEVGSFQLYP